MIDFNKLRNKPRRRVWPDGTVVWRTVFTNEALVCKHQDAEHDTDCSHCDGKGWWWRLDDDAPGGWRSEDCPRCQGKPLIQGPNDRTLSIEPADPDYELFEDCD